MANNGIFRVRSVNMTSKSAGIWSSYTVIGRDAEDAIRQAKRLFTKGERDIREAPLAVEHVGWLDTSGRP